MKSWYENIEWIGDYRFPLEHNGKDCREILTEWMSDYVGRIQNCSILQKDDIARIETFSRGLIECYDLYLNSKFPEAYSTFNCLMDSVKDFLLYVDIGKKDYRCNMIDSYYRIIPDKETHNYQYMLHIPLKKRYVASTNRFSIPGMPCSYLASELTLCWYECGMPVTFQMAKYDINLDTANGKELLRLDINPLQTAISLRSQFYNNISEEDVKEYIKSVCYTFPLVAACSVVVENKDVKFIEEYVLPQMLMAWIKSTTKVAGIRYNSDVKNELARNWCDYNIALPVRDDIADGYCGYLTSLFKNSMTETSETINMNVFTTDAFSTKIKSIEDFYYKVYWEQKHLKSNNLKQDLVDVDALGKIVDFTQNLLVLLGELKKEDTNWAYATVLTILNLSSWGKLIEERVEKVSPEVADMKREFVNLVLKFVEELSSRFRFIQYGEN